MPFCKPSPAKQQRMSSTEHSEDERLQFPFRAIEPSTSPSLTDSGQADPSPSTSGLSSTGHMHKGDIGVNIGSLTRLSDADKYALLVDPYVPPTRFNFPKHVEHGPFCSNSLGEL